MEKNLAIFLDRDGTINEEVGYLDREDKLVIIDSAFEAIRLINASGFKAVVITNQAGIAKGLFSEDFVRQINHRIQTALLERGAFIDRFYFCPHHPTEGGDPYRMICNCRKPEPGLLTRAAFDLSLDLNRCYMIGDRLRDIETAHRAGAKGVLVMTGYGRELMRDKGPDQLNDFNRPDHTTTDILEAVHWILQDRR